MPAGAGTAGSGPRKPRRAAAAKATARTLQSGAGHVLNIRRLPPCFVRKGGPATVRTFFPYPHCWGVGFSADARMSVQWPPPYGTARARRTQRFDSWVCGPVAPTVPYRGAPGPRTQLSNGWLHPPGSGRRLWGGGPASVPTMARGGQPPSTMPHGFP